MRFAKNKIGNVEETRYAYAGSSKNSLLKVRERLCRGGKNPGKEQKGTEPP
jgi:hypothetical protein